jgi:hypothetical protein
VWLSERDVRCAAAVVVVTEWSVWLRGCVQSLSVALAATVGEGTSLVAVWGSGSTVFQGAVFVVACMQGVFVVLALLFGRLWLQAVRRVRARLEARRVAVTRVNAALAGLAVPQLHRVAGSVMSLQSHVRRQRARRQSERRLVARAFEGAHRERKLFTRLVHGLVLLYIVGCVFVIAAYGLLLQCAGGFVVSGVARRGGDCLRCAVSRCRARAGLKFSSELQRTWLIASVFGFCMDVFVYNTFAQFVRAVVRFLVLISTGTDGSTLAHGISKAIDISSCSLSSLYAP